MAQQTIDTEGTTDTLKSGFEKVNANFGELYERLSADAVAYVRVSGSNTTGNGSPAKPYQTLQKAWDEGFRSYNLGVGNMGSLTLPESGLIETVILNIYCVSGTVIGLIHRAEVTGTYGLVVHFHGPAAVGGVSTSGTESAVHAVPVKVFGYPGLTIGAVSANGAGGSPAGEEDTGGDGGNAGQIQVIGPMVIELVSAVPGDGGSGGLGQGNMGQGGSLHASQGVIVNALDGSPTLTGRMAIVESTFCGFYD